MRTRLIITGTFLALVGAALVVQACGDSDPVTPAPEDAGADVVVDVAETPTEDAAPPEEEDAAPCDTTKSFLEEIPDASVADGASTTGICAECASTKCSAQVEACNQDCPCQEMAPETLQCFLQNPQNPLFCAARFATVPQATQQVGLALFQCLNTSCKEECAMDALPLPDAGGGGGG